MRPWEEEGGDIEERGRNARARTSTGTIPPETGSKTREGKRANDALAVPRGRILREGKKKKLTREKGVNRFRGREQQKRWPLLKVAYKTKGPEKNTADYVVSGAGVSGGGKKANILLRDSGLK